MSQSRTDLREPEPLWVWQVVDTDGRWGTVAAIVPQMEDFGTIPLFTRVERIARENYGPVAKAHGKAIGREVRLHRFDFTEDRTDG
jgi:hypothetical protein